MAKYVKMSSGPDPLVKVEQISCSDCAMVFPWAVNPKVEMTQLLHYCPRCGVKFDGSMELEELSGHVARNEANASNSSVTTA
jgi:uncharacterized paraquat-inducible protein A